jgi:hypothetical protein
VGEVTVAINLTCDCGRKLQIKDEFAGKEGRCPACGRTLQIPFPEESGYASPLGVPAVPVASVREETESEPPPDEPAEQEEGEPLGNHGGESLPANADFFAAPPEEIGPLGSAYTTLRQGKQPMPLGMRLVAGGGAGLLGLVVGLVINQLFSVRSDFWQAAWPLGGGMLGVALVVWRTAFRHSCSYVGQEGVARFTCSGNRDNITEAEVFRFRDAAELRTSQTLHYTNSVYQNTSYNYRWTDVGGRLRYEISGSHNSEAGTPPSTDPYQFARAAEIAWTVYMFEQVYRQLELSGTVAFNLKGGRWIRLGPGVVIFGLSGEPEECPVDELDEASVKKGMVCIKRRDAREGWFSSSGVYRFSFDELANAQLFFHILEKVVGLPVS